ncbi:MAG: c-type cytochrome [Acidobacteria bacterium]|nr:c-type cytochrome [Acidobacteriota bacterium]
MPKSPFSRSVAELLSLSLLAVWMLGASHQPRSLSSKRLDIPLGLDAYMPVPEDNPITPEKVTLGRKLFFDRRLSRNKRVSCATCHDPRRAFTDGRPVAAGIFGKRGTRSAPTLVNRGYGAAFFWDGRIRTLEEQVLKPIQDPKEMDMTLAEASKRVRISTGELAAALASYVRTILSGNAPADRYLNGDREALSEEARQGLNLFRGKANCSACHVGPNFTDERFHNTGVAWPEGRLLDPGRFTVTGNEADRGAFKTPTLREIARTAPYMHDGSLISLEDVVEYYDRGANRNPYLDLELRPLRLTREEKQALIAFLQSLSGKICEGLRSP